MEDRMLTMRRPTGSSERYSGVELFRILAVILICSCHTVQTAYHMFDMSAMNIANGILRSFNYMGQVGNIIFIMSSAYFLSDSHSVKPEKPLNILLDSSCISVVIFLGYVFAGYKFSTADTISYIFPGTFGRVWFVPAYAWFYLAHPIVNFVLRRLDKYGHIFVLGILMMLYFVFGGGSFFEFLITYVIIAYFKHFADDFCKDKKKNVIGFLAFFSAYVVWCAIKYVYGRADWPDLEFWFSPFIMPWVLCLFNLFNLVKLKNKAINYLASCSLFVYCIHGHALIGRIVPIMLYQHVLDVSPNEYFGWIILCCVIVVVGGFALAVIYKETFARLTKLVAKWICVGLVKLLNWIFDLFKKPKKRTEQINNA